jgi:hypothetical protein
MLPSALLMTRGSLAGGPFQQRLSAVLAAMLGPSAALGVGHRDISDVSHYRVAPEAPWARSYPQSKGQRKFTSRLETLLGAALLADARLKEQLVEKHGFTVHQASRPLAVCCLTPMRPCAERVKGAHGEVHAPDQ